MHRLFFKYWKYGLILIVLLTAFFAFLETDMVDHDQWRYCRAMYYAVDLFIVGGVDIGLPSGGSDRILVILWICYFLAPLLTLSIVYQVIQERIFSHLSPWFKRHTVICGLGRNGKLIYDLVKENAPRNHKIVLLEKDVHNPRSEMLNRSKTTWWLKDDFSQYAVLRKARVQYASKVYITTNQDLVNLNTMVLLLSMPDLPRQMICYSHVGNLPLQTLWRDTFLKEEKYHRVHLFNGYQSVTRRFYQHWIREKGAISPDGTLFMVLGYGQFGQMLFYHLASDHSRTSRDELVVVTRKLNIELKKQKYEWALQQAAPNCHILPTIEADILTPECWQRMAELIRNSGRTPIICLCRDNDMENIGLAISMKLDGPEELRSATIFCRIYSNTAGEINEILEKSITPFQSKDIILFPMQHELKEAFREELFK